MAKNHSTPDITNEPHMLGKSSPAKGTYYPTYPIMCSSKTVKITCGYWTKQSVSAGSGTTDSEGTRAFWNARNVLMCQCG